MLDDDVRHVQHRRAELRACAHPLRTARSLQSMLQVFFETLFEGNSPLVTLMLFQEMMQCEQIHHETQRKRKRGATCDARSPGPWTENAARLVHSSAQSDPGRAELDWTANCIYSNLTFTASNKIHTPSNRIHTSSHNSSIIQWSR